MEILVLKNNQRCLKKQLGVEGIVQEQVLRDKERVNNVL